MQSYGLLSCKSCVLFLKVLDERYKSVENSGCEKHFADAAVNTSFSEKSVTEISTHYQ